MAYLHFTKVLKYESCEVVEFREGRHDSELSLLQPLGLRLVAASQSLVAEI